MTTSIIKSGGPKNIFTRGNLLINTAETIIVNVTEDTSLNLFSGQCLYSTTGLLDVGHHSDIWIKKNFRQFQGELLIESKVDYFNHTNRFSEGDIVTDVHNDIMVCVVYQKEFGPHFEGVIIKDSFNVSTAKRGVHTKHFEFSRFSRERTSFLVSNYDDKFLLYP